MKIKCVLVFILFIITANRHLMAQEWITPVIEGYGNMVDNKSEIMTPDPEKDYKVVFHIKSDTEREGVNEGLFKVARLINLMGNAGVPKNHLHIVAIISEKGYNMVLSNTAHQKRFQKDNPNLDLLEKLTDFGVEILICSQTLGQKEVDELKELNPYTKVTLSALTAVVGFQMEGYVPMF